MGASSIVLARGFKWAHYQQHSRYFEAGAGGSPPPPQQQRHWPRGVNTPQPPQASLKYSQQIWNWASQKQHVLMKTHAFVCISQSSTTKVIIWYVGSFHDFSRNTVLSWCLSVRSHFWGNTTIFNFPFFQMSFIIKHLFVQDEEEHMSCIHCRNCFLVNIHLSFTQMTLWHVKSCHVFHKGKKLPLCFLQSCSFVTG